MASITLEGKSNKLTQEYRLTIKRRKVDITDNPKASHLPLYPSQQDKQQK